MLTKNGLLKSGNLMGRPVSEQPAGMFTQQTDRFIDDDNMDSNTVTKSDLSIKHKVNDRVRKMLDQSSNVATRDSNTHSLIWRMFMSSALETSIFMRKHYSNLRSIKKRGNNLTMKQMFDISEKLIAEQSGEIYGVGTMNLEDSSMKQVIFGQ